MLEVGAPQWVSAPPPTGNLGSASGMGVNWKGYISSIDATVLDLEVYSIVLQYKLFMLYQTMGTAQNLPKLNK